MKILSTFLSKYERWGIISIFWINTHPYLNYARFFYDFNDSCWYEPGTFATSKYNIKISFYGTWFESVDTNNISFYIYVIIQITNKQ